MCSNYSVGSFSHTPCPTPTGPLPLPALSAVLPGHISGSAHRQSPPEGRGRSYQETAGHHIGHVPGVSLILWHLHDVLDNECIVSVCMEHAYCSGIVFTVSCMYT